MKKGIYLALLTSFISGFSIFYGKIAVSGLDPLVFTVIKNGLVALILSGILFINVETRHAASLQLNLKKKGWLKLLLIGLIGGGLPFALFFIGLTKTSALNANMLHKTLFIWVAILAIPFLHERLTKLQIAGYMLVFSSNFLIGGFKGFSFNSGELMIFAATILWAIENVIAKKTLTTISPMIVAWARMTFGLVIVLAITAYQGKLSILTALTPTQLQIGLVSGLLLTGYVLSWYKALSLAPATLVSSILVSATIITNLLSVVFIEHKTPTFDTNSLLLLAGIALIVFKNVFKRFPQLSNER